MADKPPGRVRADLLVVARGLAPTRAKSQALILAGRVFSAARRIEKPGELLREDAPLEVSGGPARVARSAAKLEGALDGFEVDPSGRDCLDVGASTGGFTQILLERGARHVACVDVGRGQLDWTLRNDPRVTVHDGINARYLERSMLTSAPTLAVVDVSFIALSRVLPAVVACSEPGGEVVALVKPQFEVGRGKVGAGGIVRDARLHREVLDGLAAYCTGQGWGIAGVMPSPIRGAEGNLEFFLHIVPARPGLSPADLDAALDRAVDSPPSSPNHHE